MIKNKLKDMKLSQKISIIICAILVVIFTIFIAITVTFMSREIKKSTNDEITATARSNGMQIQQIFDESLRVNESIANYMQKAYDKASDRKLMELSGLNSEVIPTLELTKAASQAEEFMIESAKGTAATDNGVYAVGVMFEPYGFSSSTKEYSFYMDARKGDGTAFISDALGDYATYSKEFYYKDAVESKQIVFSEPFIYDGVWTISVSTPIIYNNEVKGVVVSDIEVPSFSKVNATSESYPSMYAAILSDMGTVAFDSRDGVEIGGNTKDFFQKTENYEKYLSESAKGEAFTLISLSTDGETLQRFYYPISAGNATWWSLTAVVEKEVVQASTTAAIILIIIAIVAVLVIVVIIVFTLRSMLKPINSVVEAAESLSHGNLNISIQSDSGDEIGILAAAFGRTIEFLKTLINDISRILNEISNNNLDVNTNAEYVGDFVTIQDSINNIVENLNNVMLEITQSAEQVAGGAEQLSGASQSLAEGATDQASAVEELFALINETTEQVGGAGKAIKSASIDVEEVGSEVMNSNQEMKGMISAMNEISDSSKQIELITKSIEDIASQTNLLSLNAAIEAARAGEAGKGFAVVADEIRELASQSAEAARNTRSLVANSINAVENGTMVADSMEKSLNVLVDKISSVVDTMGGIATVASQQTESMEQVNQGVEQISAVVQNNSAVAQESAATSEELSAQAQSFNEIASSFKLKI